jgi:predicted Zn-dependent protease
MRHLLALLCLSAATALAQPAATPVLAAMQAELDRSIEHLKSQPNPPYFLSYEVTEVNRTDVSGAFGTLTRSSQQQRRNLDIDLRIGDYKLDNTHPIRGGGNNGSRSSWVEMPTDNDPDAIRANLWYQTDLHYKRAVEQLTAAKTNASVKIEQEDNSGDFSPAPAEKYSEPVAAVHVDRKGWEDKIRKYTAPFQRYGNIYDAAATLVATAETRWYVSTDGSRIQTSQPSYLLMIWAFTKAADGMELPRYETFFSFTPEGLPDDATVLKAVDKMIEDLKALKNAPIVDPYAGPAILSGRATGVFFHEVFGHRLESHRNKGEDQSQTFKKFMNERVLPDFISVYSDPTRRQIAGVDLNGSYRYDNQGVKARPVTVVDKGILKTFLLSRTPIQGFPESNGHGRKQAGFAPVARQSNLIVTANSPISRAELKNRLLEEVKKQGKPFGLLFDDIQGGFTMTGRTTPNAFNVLPIMVYRIYPDGREELVRGVDLIGTPLTVFTRIIAADDEVAVFNGTCGAESGGVPVSASGPGILVSQLEVQKKQKSQERSPILAPPFDDR